VLSCADHESEYIGGLKMTFDPMGQQTLHIGTVVVRYPEAALTFGRTAPVFLNAAAFARHSETLQPN
jgi:hypothetical protein